MHPTRDQQGLALHHGPNERQAGPFGIADLGEVTINDVVGKTFDGFEVAARGKILEGSDPDVWMRRGSARLPVTDGRDKLVHRLRPPPGPVWSEFRAHASLR